MKYRKLRFLSVVCVASLIISQGAIAANSVDNGDPGSTSGYSQTDVTPISVDDLEIKVEKKEYNGNTTANATVTVKPDLLNGKNVTVKYTAAAFDNENAGENKAVTISGLHLEGEDKDAFSLDIDEAIQVSTSVITKKVIKLTPSDTILHYSSEKFPISLKVSDARNQILPGDKVSDIPSNIFIVKSGNDYFYSLEENKVVDGKDSTNKNYRFIIDESIQLDVKESEEAKLLPAEFVSSKDIPYHEGLGFITKDDVSIVLRAQPGMPDNGLSFYVTSDNIDENNTYFAHTDSNEYKSQNISLHADNDSVRTVEIKCSLVEGTEPSPIQFSNGTVDSNKLIIDKEEPWEKNENKLKLAADNEKQQICLSGTVCDNGSGIKSVSYKWKKDKTYEKQITDIQEGTKELKIDNVPLFDYSEFQNNNEVVVKVTDLAGNTKNFELSCENVGVELAEPVITSITLKSGEKTELDKLLNILSFGIYSKNENLILEIKAAPAGFEVDNKKIEVSLIDKENNSVFKAEPDDKKSDGTLIFSLGVNDEKTILVQKLSVKIVNGYGIETIVSLREALDSNGHWNTAKTTDSDKWVFDKTAPKIKIDLGEHDNRYYVAEKTKTFNITATDDPSGISEIHVYNQSKYSIRDENNKKILLSDENDVEYTVTSIDKNGITLADSDGNEDKVSLKKPENASDENDVIEYNIFTSCKYFITSSDDFFSVCGVRKNGDDFELIAKDGNAVKYYPIKSDEIEPVDEITFGNVETVDFKVSTDSLINGSNDLYVTAVDNAGNSINKSFDVYFVKNTPEVKLELSNPETNLINGNDWITNKAIEDYRNINSDKSKASVKVLLTNDTNCIESIKVTANNIEIDKLSSEDCNTNEIIIELDKNLLEQILNTDNYENNNLIQLQAVMTTNIFDFPSQETISNIYVDKKDPTISKIEVIDTTNPIEKIINVLSFGVFNNNRLTLCVYANDGNNDVGIESVKLSYDGNNNTITSMSYNDENGYYYCNISRSTEVFKENIVITVTDKLNRQTNDLPNISNTDPDNRKEFPINFVMIENIAPDVNFSDLMGDNSPSGNSWFKASVFDNHNINDSRTYKLTVSDKDSGVRKIDVLLEAGGNKIELIKDSKGKSFVGSDYEENPQSAITDEQTYYFAIDDLADKAGDVDGKYILSATVCDNAGNDITESTTFYRDITSPTVTDFRFSNPSQTENEKDKTDRDEMSGVTIDQDQNIVKTDYGYYFKENFDLTVYAEDDKASSGFASVTLTLVDYTDGNAVRKESDTKNCIYDLEGSVVFPTFTIKSGFKGMILAEVTDNTGNVSGEYSPRAFVSDNSDPEISIKVNNEPLPSVIGSNGDKLYIEDEVSFTVTITDTKSGLKEIVYNGESDHTPGYNFDETTMIDDKDHKEIGTDAGDGWIVRSSDLNVVTSVEKTFSYGEFDDTGIIAKFTAKDNANNSNENQTFRFTIDRVKPGIDKVSLNSFDVIKEAEFTDDFEYRYFYKEPFTITTQASDPDPSSGLNKMDYRFVTYDTTGKVTNDDSVKDVIIDSGKTDNVQIPESFTKGQIFVKAYDNTLKNVSDEKGIYGVVVDHTAPTITIDELPNTNDNNDAIDDDGNMLYNDPGKVSFKVTIKDTESGIKNIHYSKSSEKTVGLSERQTSIDVSNPEYIIGSIIGNAENASDWTIEAMDHNLVTKVSRVFEFDKDDKNIQFVFDATDRSENKSDTETSQSFTIDTAAPSVTGIKFSIKTADNISEVKPEEFIEELEYGYYFKEEMVITASCEDSRPSSGLKMLSFRFVPYKDGKQIEQSQYAEPKKSDVNDFVVAEKVVNGKASCKVEKGFKGQIFVTAYDYAAFYYNENASKEITTKAFVIEDNAPNIKIDELPETSLTDDLGNKLYTDKVSFRVTITDTESGLREVSYAKRSDNIEDDKTAKETVSQKIVNNSKDYKVGYKFKGTEWVIERMDNNLVTEVSQTFVFDDDDKNIYMIFGAVDRSNNKAADKNSEKFTIDTVNPTVEKFNFEPASEDNISEVTDFIEELEYGYYFKKSFNAVVTVDDKIPSSGLDKVIFRLVAYENGEYVSEESYSVAVKDKKANYLIPEGFKGQIYAKVFDRAVNESFEETPQAFVVDEVAPVITIEPLPDNNDKTDMDGNKLYAHSVQFKVTVSDTKSGLRNIFYSKSSEKNSFDDVSTQIQNVTQYKEGDEISNGWQITKMDNNLVTEVTQVFTFNDDDNHIVMNYRAVDRSMNSSENVKSESFTIDTTAPVVRVSYPEPVNGMYYKESVTFTFSITERNFDSSLMERTIKDSFRSNNGLQISYNSSSITEHTATVTFPEGDYEFAYSGEDRGGNKAQFFEEKSTSGFSSFNKSFYVDATNPKIVSADFYGDGEDNLFKNDYYNKDSIPHIKVTIEEHNVSKNSISSYIKLGFKTASSGEAHNVQNLSDTDWYFISNEDWKSLGNDRFSIDIDFNNEKYHDGVYQIIMELTDPAENKGENVQSKIFELDRVVPVLSQRNDEDKDFVVSPFVDVYDEKRKDEKAPSLSFYDINFEKLVIKADVFKTKYIEDNQIISMEKDVLSDELSKTYNNESFNLDKYFDDDGVYVFTFTAYDKAGNASKEINDTYFKMVKTDCLAYIANSDAGKHTGYYSLMDNNQRAISKKATDFSDLDITIVTKNDDDNSYSIEIKDNKDQKQHIADDSVTLNSSKIGNSETAVMKEMRLPGSYFSETFKDDSLDARMDLSVLKKPANKDKEKNQSADTEKTTSYYLAKIHIDNEKPSATLPEFFHSWSNVMFTDNVEVTLTNISEKLDMSKTKIYECPREGDRVEIQLTDSNYDESKKKLTFTLSEGIHNIDISLVDEAGNEWNVDRIRYFTVGNLWLYVGIGVVFGIAAIVVTIILIRKNKKSKKKTVQAT